MGKNLSRTATPPTAGPENAAAPSFATISRLPHGNHLRLPPRHLHTQLHVRPRGRRPRARRRTPLSALAYGSTWRVPASGDGAPQVDVGPPQLVRYVAGQRFNLHSDWWGVPRAAADGSGRGWNRVANFLVGLQNNCTGEKMYFPYVAPPVVPGLGGEADESVLETEDEGMMRWWTGKEPVWRRHPKGGVAFRSVAGNAVFWANLHVNGTGDTKIKHAGLPIGEGLKTAINIWLRQYYL
ncbi:hypothetical protein RB595_003739 [Gaeumannomyces hyphopodioides]